ncbi:MAG TPA: site-specific integrase, partial [Chitinophagaceae bacterium]
MAEVHFVLKEPQSKEPTLIYLLYRFNNQKLKYSTGQKILPKFWNPENQRPRAVTQFANHETLTAFLKQVAATVDKVYIGLLNKNIQPTPGKLRDALNQALFKEEYAQKQGFLKFVEELIETSNRRQNTLKQWKQTLNKLIAYKQAKRKEVDFDTIDLGFYNDFINFLTGQGYTKNTIGGFIKNVKVFLNEAVDRKLTHNLEYRNRKFKVIEEQVEKIYLTEEEILRIYNLKLINQHRLARVRDLFVVACYTGLRFSDLAQITPENIVNGGNQIRIKTQKTGEVVVIPVHRLIREILAKYDGMIPPMISNQKMNQYLKELGEGAAINEPVK